MDKMKLRDFLALPFLFGALLLDTIAIRIGDSWTINTYILGMRNKERHIDKDISK